MQKAIVLCVCEPSDHTTDNKPLFQTLPFSGDDVSACAGEEAPMHRLESLTSTYPLHAQIVNAWSECSGG
jgi:hypothetical protein